MRNKFLYFLVAFLAYFVYLKARAQDLSPFLKKHSPFWNLEGNSNATLSNKIGTTNNVSLRFVTNNIERMKIHRSGNVGIGTPSPSQKLHVVGKGLFTSGLTVSNGGISGTNTAIEGIGVYGSGNYGVYGYSKIYFGVYGEGPSYGVVGKGLNYGVYGFSENVGVQGDGTDWGVRGTTNNGFGVYGESISGRAVVGFSQESYGGDFFSNNSYGLVAGTTEGFYAGYFTGAVYATAGYSTSDKNLKNNIEDFSDAMSIIGKLKPRYYEFRHDGKFAALHLPKGKHYGLIAQELETVLPDLIKEAPQELITPSPQALTQKSADGKIQTVNALQKKIKKETINIKAVNYTELIPIMVKAMQEQQQQIEELSKKAERVVKLEDEVASLKQMIIDLKSGNTNNNNNLSSAYLEQNVPNPFSNNTIIRYHLPNNFINAQIMITDMKGAVIKSIPLKSNGNGQVTLNAGVLAAGTYTYSLWIDNQQADSKQMVITR